MQSITDEDRGIGSVTRQSKHFLARSEGDRKKEVQCLFVLIFFFSLLPSKIKPVAVQQALNSCQRKGDRELKLKDVLNAKRQWLSEDRLFFMFLPYMYD